LQIKTLQPIDIIGSSPKCQGQALRVRYAQP
jgi:hypothetical protein